MTGLRIKQAAFCMKGKISLAYSCYELTSTSERHKRSLPFGGDIKSKSTPNAFQGTLSGHSKAVVISKFIQRITSAIVI
jgi:hypothetical protein